MQFTHVVELRSLLRQLESRLILHNPLSHGGRVRIGDRDHVNPTIEVVDPVEVTVHVVGVLLRHVVVDDPREDAQLVLHGCVQAGLDARHDLEAALEQGQRGAHRRVCAHVPNLDVCHGADATAFLDDVAKQRVQDARRLLVWHREQALTERTTRHVSVTPFTGHKWGVITFDTQRARL